MNYNALIPELSVTNIHQTKAFYLDILGFQLCYERPEDGFIFVALDGNQLMLEKSNDHWNTGALEYPFGRGVNFEMSVSEIDSIYARVLAAGIKPFVPMHTVAYRVDDGELTQKQFLVMDPDGYLLRFVEA